MGKKEQEEFLAEKAHILDVLKRVKKALVKNKYIQIKELSNNILHHSSIYQEPDIISVTVIVYALSKIIERDDYKKLPGWDSFYEKYILGINNAVHALEQEDRERFRNEIQSIIESIQKLSGKLRVYIDEVFRNAKINKASRIYEHGISMEKTAKILGISLWELAEYTGKTGIANVNLGITIPIEQRIKYAQGIFKK